MPKTRVAVLCGGTSGERDVSLRSGEMIRRNLDPEAYEATLVDLRDLVSGGAGKLEDLRGFDVVFLALHGPGGEDGSIQGVLELLGVPYTGSGVLASALAMNKVKTKQAYVQNGIPTAPWVTADLATHDGTRLRADVEREIGYPCVLKADNQGSTQGVSVVRGPEEFDRALAGARAWSTEVLVERFATGTEISCGVLGGADPAALPVIEIVPASGFFDYEAKYTPGASQEIVPARLDAPTTAQVQELAVCAHRVLGCWGMSRTDMIVGADGGITVLETNTIPGLTETSLLPQEARAAGIMMPELADRLIRWALERQARRPAASDVPRQQADVSKP